MMDDTKFNLFNLVLQLLESLSGEYLEPERNQRFLGIIESLRVELNQNPQQTNQLIQEGSTQSMLASAPQTSGASEGDPEIDEKAKGIASIFSMFGKTISDNIHQGKKASVKEKEDEDLNNTLEQLRQLRTSN